MLWEQWVLLYWGQGSKCELCQTKFRSPNYLGFSLHSPLLPVCSRSWILIAVLCLYELKSLSLSVWVVIGKELFTRFVLMKMKEWKAYKTTEHVTGVVLIPETGAPCSDFVWPVKVNKDRIKKNYFTQAFSDITVELALEVRFCYFFPERFGCQTLSR